MKIISKEPLRVATLSGAVVLFEAGVEREVGDEIGKIALTMGAEMVGYSSKAKPKSEARKTLVEIMNEIISDENPDNFKANGTPKAAVVNRYAGHTVSTAEREEAWEQALNA
jgi:hypothetical protein